MKLMRNSKFWDGILAQVPQYAKSEEVTSAFFVAVAYTDADLSPQRVNKVERAAQLASAHNSLDIAAVIIDARLKLSASKLKATEEERSQLDQDESTGSAGFMGSDDPGPDDVV
jgi:hypothetical protein